MLKHDDMNGSSIVAGVTMSLDESKIYKRATGCKDGANSSLTVKLTEATSFMIMGDINRLDSTDQPHASHSSGAFVKKKRC